MICIRRRSGRSSLSVIVDDVAAAEDHRAGGRLGQAQDRPAERRLAAAGLADEAEDLARLDLEVDAVDRVDVADLAAEDPADDREVLLQPGHREQRVVGPGDGAGASGVARSPRRLGREERLVVAGGAGASGAATRPRPPRSAGAGSAPAASAGHLRRGVLGGGVPGVGVAIDHSALRRLTFRAARCLAWASAQRPSPSGVCIRHRAGWPGPPALYSSGGFSRQSSQWYGQRGSNRHAGGMLNGTGTVPLIADSRPPRFDDRRDRFEEAHRVRGARLDEDLVDRALLHDLAGVHDDDVLDHLGDDAEVVGDQQQRRVGPLLDGLRGARGSGPGSSRRAPSSARRRSAASARTTAPSRSSRAGACRRTSRADTA